MELTQQQLQEVEKYLETKNFDFIDLKIEVLDHIISDIESFLEKGYSFETAFSMVRVRWEKHFRESSSFYFGLFYSESKIVINKALKMFKPFYVLYLSAYFLPVILLKLSPIQFDKTFVDFTNGFVLSIASISLMYMLYILVKVRLSKVKTTYRFVLKTQYVGSIFLILGVFIGEIFNEQGEMNPVFTGFTLAGFAVTFICHYFFKKHQEEIQNHQYILN